MTLLSIVQNVCDLVDLPRPTTVIGSANKGVRQLLGLANQQGKAMARAYEWEALQKEATHTTIAAELQGTLASIASDINFDVSLTYWNRSKSHTLRRIDPREWQLRKSSGVTGVYQDFRIRDKSLYIIPAPEAGETIAFEYISKNWCQSADGLTEREAWGADTDTCILDEFLFELGLLYRWLRAKRLDYGEEMREYMVQLNLAMERDGGNKPVLTLDDSHLDRPSGIVIPDGNWNIS